ncbi:GSCOCG00004533001-RA-CDS, partial [Cotesia congregata]
IIYIRNLSITTLEADRNNMASPSPSSSPMPPPQAP